jgi:phage shock protein A
MFSDLDHEAASLNADYASLKLEHERLIATPHSARALEAHVAKLRAHIQRLHTCIEQLRQRSTPGRDSTASASEASDTSSPVTAGLAACVVNR